MSNYEAQPLSGALNLPAAGHLSSGPDCAPPSPAPLCGCALHPRALAHLLFLNGLSHSQLGASALAGPSARNTLCPQSQSILSPNGSEVPSSRGHPAHPIYDFPYVSQLFSNMVHDSLIVFISPHHTYRMPASQGRGCRSVSLLCPAGPGVPGRKQLLISPPQPFVLSEGGAHSSQGGDGQGLLGSFLERPLAFLQMDTPDVRPPPTSPWPALILLCLWALGPGRPFIW